MILKWPCPSLQLPQPCFGTCLWTHQLSHASSLVHTCLLFSRAFGRMQLREVISVTSGRKWWPFYFLPLAWAPSTAPSQPFLQQEQSQQDRHRLAPFAVLSSFTKHLLGGLVGKESSCNAGDLGSIPGLGKSPGEGNGTPVFLPGKFQGLYSPWGHKESDTTGWLTHISDLASVYRRFCFGTSKMRFCLSEDLSTFSVWSSIWTQGGKQSGEKTHALSPGSLRGCI